ncbi:MAG: RHS repeat domain-containing protein, partial [Candidatus Binatia bacterium]
SGGTKIGEQNHYPFGEAWNPSGTTTKWQFTSYERDTESSLDYAMFRYDSSRLGRFLTPDPLAGSIANPQSLNRYAYVLNDPVNLIDPLGLEPECGFFPDCPCKEGQAPPCYCCKTEGSAEGDDDTGDEGPGPGNSGYDASNPGRRRCFIGNPDIGVLVNIPCDFMGGPIGTPIPPHPCEFRILKAINTQFGTNATPANVLPNSGFENGGAVNTRVRIDNLPAEQFNPITPGRFGGNIGFGPSLHIPSVDARGQKFKKTNKGGRTSVEFTAHIDSANAHRGPIGLAIHVIIDVIGSDRRNPCPQ